MGIGPSLGWEISGKALEKKGNIIPELTRRAAPGYPAAAELRQLYARWERFTAL
jgi:hypothetical protein